jgi:hypothetical protein
MNFGQGGIDCYHWIIHLFVNVFLNEPVAGKLPAFMTAGNIQAEIDHF